jgi:hypothetical protein
MTEPLLLAALGESVGEPDYGETAGSDGVYCYFPAAGAAETNVEAQVDLWTQDEFEAQAELLGVTEPLTGVGQLAYSLDSAYTGLPGASVMAWDDGVSVTVNIERDGADAAEVIEAAKQIAASVLASI